MMEVKNIVTIVLIVFVVAVIIIFGAVALQNNAAPVPAISTDNSSIPASEVAAHSSQNDCWVILDEKVYNVTNLISQHPGGAQAIISFCGKDAAQAFQERNGRGPHPEKSQEKLDDDYFIGNVQNN